MYELSLLLIELFSFMSFFLFLFIYSTISNDLVIVFMAFLIFLILLIPFSKIIEFMICFIEKMSLPDYIFLSSITYCCNLINFLIGIFLFIEIIYLFFFT